MAKKQKTTKQGKNTGRKFDEGKPRWQLLPLGEVEEVVQILTQGASTHGDYNWQLMEDTDRYIGALFRHIKAWRCGEILDKESGLHHLAHAICNCLFLMWFDNKEYND